MNLCIVGNGIIRKPQGHIINQMDVVIRLSTYRIKGFEHLVGTKTNIASVARIENLEPLPPKIWIANPLGLSDTPKVITDRTYPNGYEFPTTERLKTIYSHYKLHPTLGSLTIWLAYYWGRGFFDKIYITGFNFGHMGRPIYYYDPEIFDEDNVKLNEGHHDPTNERYVLKQMIADQKVQLIDPTDIIMLEEKF